MNWKTLELRPFSQNGQAMSQFVTIKMIDGRDAEAESVIKSLAYARFWPEAREWTILSEELGKLYLRLEPIGYRLLALDSTIQDLLIQKRAEAICYHNLVNEINNNPVDFPGFKKPLFAYQAADVELMTLKPRVLNANQVGLGKGVEAIAAAVKLKQEGKINHALIICPAGIKTDFKDKIKEFTNETFTVISGTQKQRENRHEQAKNSLFTIINYDLLRIKTIRERGKKPVQIPSVDLLKISERDFGIVLLDEVTALKSGTGSQQGAGVLAILEKAPRVIGFSGTPLMNYLDELRQIITTIDPKFFPSKSIFDKVYINPVTGKPRSEMMPALHERVKGIMIRRKKEDVLRDLPEKLPPVNRYVELSGEQKEKYQEALQEARVYLGESLTDGTPVHVIIKTVLSQMMRLKQICVSPELLEWAKGAEATKTKHDSAKLKEVIYLLQNDLRDEKVVIFTQFEKMTRIMDRELSPLFGPCLKYTGTLNEKQKEESRHAFQSDPTRKIMLLTRAGGMGLTLTAAHNIILLDQEWNPAWMEQIIGRLHRIGQHSIVTPIWLWTENTIEQRVYRTLVRKTNLFNQVIEGQEVQAMEKKLTVDDAKDWLEIGPKKEEAP